jgi:hypothetical protein
METFILFALTGGMLLGAGILLALCALLFALWAL